MKKVVILAIMVCVLTSLLATNVFASDGLSGTSYVEYVHNNTDAKVDIQGGMEVYPSFLSRTKFGGDFFRSLVKGNSGQDATLGGWRFKSAFGIITSDQFELDCVGSVAFLNGDSETGNAEYRPFMLGLETKLALNERMYIDGNVDWAVACKKYKRDNIKDVDADYMMAKAKLNYLITDKFGMNVGYTWDKIDVANNKTDTKGYTAGIVYRW